MFVSISSAVFLLYSAFGIADAAQCCGQKVSIRESTLWDIREKLCSDPTSGEPTDSGFQHKQEVGAGLGSTEYVLWGRADDNDFRNCWDATAQIIEQCARSDHSAGTWQLDNEQYAMSAASTVYRKKRGDLTPLPDLIVSSLSGSGYTDYPTPSDGKLPKFEDGRYDVDGIAVDVQFKGLDLLEDKFDQRDLNKRSILHTNSGPIANWTIGRRNTVNLKDTITDAVRTARRAKHRRDEYGQRCDIGEHGTYAMVEIGDWTSDWEPASGRGWDCGPASKCALTKTSSITWTETFSITLGATAKQEIADAAFSVGYSWSKSYTNAESFECGWEEGKCRVYYVNKDFVWQRGFTIDAQSLGVGQTTIATVSLVHSDAPKDKTENPNCSLGCCRYNAPTPIPDFCKDSPKGLEDYYGVCGFDKESYAFKPPLCQARED